MFPYKKTYSYKITTDVKGIKDICKQEMDERTQNPLKYSLPKNKKLFDDCFMCSICTEVVTDPRSCGSCNKLNCKKCLDKC